MRFKGRELKPYGEPVSASSLKVGDVYFSVQFADRDMLLRGRYTGALGNDRSVPDS
jgi:hypothetical protein